MSIRSGSWMDKLEFKTNQGRSYVAGGNGGDAYTIRFDIDGKSHPMVIGFRGGCGGHMHNFKVHYVVLNNDLGLNTLPSDDVEEEENEADIE